MRRLLGLITLLAALLALVPATALADGDPGSDKLYYETLFTGADDNISTAQQTQLGDLLDATKALGHPIRVAIIGRRDDLGTITALWRKPAAYAQYLGLELQLAYDKDLVVVMPDGVADYRYPNQLTQLSGIPSGGSPAQLVAAATAAVHQLERAAGVSAARLAAVARNGLAAAGQESARATTPSGVIAPVPSAPRGPTRVSPAWIILALLALLTSVFWLPPLWRRRPAWGLPAAAAAVPVVTVIALVVVASARHSTPGAYSALATSPNIDPGTAENHPATNFRLTDETGHPISLRQYRGKVVILSFTDAECQTICPLTTQAMVDARDSLGAHAKDVQLLGVDANRKSIQVEDVLSYTQLHGLIGQWHFLTGSTGRLARIWKAYGVDADINSTSNIIEHTPALYLIDTHGVVRDVYTTYQSYGAIPQFGQVMARAAAALLPAHPKVSTDYSYRTVQGISPSTATTIPKVGGGSLHVGSGGPHLYLFFATWDQQSTPIAAELKLLNRYAADAKRLGLPPLTAVDEGSVEPNHTAVSSFLAGLGGRLDYPVGVDESGRLADGYQVQGEPWFVLTDPGAANDHPWYQEVYTQGWPTLRALEAEVKGALKGAGRAATPAALKGSPPALAALHAQAAQLLNGGSSALSARVAALKGHPIVINLWASWCGPCQAEFGYFKNESAKYGARVAFLGIDYNDQGGDAAQFLHQHHVYYPSYAVGQGSVPGSILPGGVTGTPMTIYIAPSGSVSYVRSGQYASVGALDQDIQAYSLGH